MTPAPDFSPARPRNPAGPSSNTGQKGSRRVRALSAPIIDFCTVSIPGSVVRRLGFHLRELLHYVFGTGEKVVMTSLQDRAWNFLDRSATLLDETGSVAGKVGQSDADGRVVLSLTGQGCQHVPNWHHVAERLEELGAKITRLDIAVDDLTGDTFSVEEFRAAYHSGAFVMNGRPPSARYVSDEGTGRGCTLYIGQKGHKELCVYEKGKQLGDLHSRHTRCELRLYGKRLELPIDALRNPGRYFGAAYPMLVQYVVGEVERLAVKETAAAASFEAFKRFLRTQVGTGLHLICDALGEDALRFIFHEIARPGRPGRFKSYTGDLRQLIRSQVEGCHAQDHH